ncbi:alpha/beta fold hydrolase [Paenibacillus sp. GCM10023252]|uniref:alpha/beta fold hydrolase n=1 Tax=Paenibacillus sp. GCM10023252 TaxID=3252649 RepID=UPI00360B8274
MRIEKAKVKTSKGTLEYSNAGTGRPTIVLINGGSGPIEGWMKIWQEISQLSSVYAYNRLGVGASDKPRENQDGITIVETLREALTLSGMTPPYLLVGHSLGGLYANLYARLYPDEVAGLVLLEASHPNDLQLNSYQGKVVRGMNRLLSLFDSLSSHKKYNEVQFVQQTAEQIDRAAWKLAEVPLYVITGGKEIRMMPDEARRKRRENQLELAALSGKRTHIIAEKSGHFPQLSEPKVVIDAIKRCLEDVQDTSL